MIKWTTLLLCTSTSMVLPFVAGCEGGSSEVDAIPGSTSASVGAVTPRRVTIEADGCVLDSWQNEALATPAMRQVVREVILNCLTPREDGSVGPTDDSARTALKGTTAVLHGLGYKVSLGVSFTDESGERFDGVQTASWMASESWRAEVVQSIGSHQDEADGFDLDFERLPDSTRDELTALVSAVSNAVRPASTLGIFVLPSTTSPSDVAGGNAFDVQALAQAVDRIRVATLDFSVGTAGPTLDPGWAVDALRHAQMSTQSFTTALDITAPLYGWDFSGGVQRSVTFDEASGLSHLYKTNVARDEDDEPTFGYTDDSGTSHQLFYADTPSTLAALEAWDATTVPSNVGVVLWGFGAEDPSLWPALAAAGAGPGASK